MAGENLLAGALSQPNPMGSPPVTMAAPGGPVSPEMAAGMAASGLFAVMNPPNPEELVSKDVKVTDALSGLVNTFDQERMAAINHRRNTRDADWQVATANLAGRNLFADPGPGNLYTTSKAFLRKASQLHISTTSDLIRMMNPPGETVIDLEVWDGDKRNDELTGAVMTRAVRQMKGMDYGRMARKLAGHLSQFGIGYLDGPVRPPAGEMTWKADKDGRIQVEDKKLDQCWFTIIKPTRVYPSPVCESVMDASYFYVYCPMQTHEMERWAEVVKDGSRIKEMLKRPPQLNTIEAGSQIEVQTDALRRYEVWRRVGFLTSEQFALLKGRGVHSEQDYRPGACWDIYYSPADRSILHAEIRQTRPNKLCIQPVPMMTIEDVYWPQGMMDVFAAIQDAINRAFRALEDQSSDLSGVQLVIDPDLIQDSDYSLKGRKTWMRRSNPLLPEESNRKPIEHFSIPNNIEQIKSLLSFYLSLIPEITGLPSYALNPQGSMGSGVRTAEQQNQLFEAAGAFIREVMGNVDEYGLEFIGSGIADFIGRQDKTFEMVGTVKCIPTGTIGAMRREIEGRKMLSAFSTLQSIGKLDWIDESRLPHIIAQSHGFYGTGIIHTPESYLAAKQAAMAEELAMQNAKNAATPTPEVKERATSSVRDSIGTAFKSTMESEGGGMNPAAPFLLEQLMESCGKASPGFYAALKAWMVRNANAAMAAGEISQQEYALMTELPMAESPSELDAGAGPGAPPPTQDPQASPHNGTVASPEEIAEVEAMAAQQPEMMGMTEAPNA